MVMNLKEKMYNLATLWLTLSVLFFLVEYLTGWLEVVTLGGLVAGAFIEGFFVLLGLKLMRIVVNKSFLAKPFVQALHEHSDLVKALIVAAAFSWEGVLTICRGLPGYTLHDHMAHFMFLLVVYPLIGIALEFELQNKEIR